MRDYKQIIILLFFILPGNISAQIDFDADITSGCDSLTVNFTYTSGITAESVLWHFGNDSTSNELNPRITYRTSGSYTVRLIVNDSLLRTKENFITVHPSPNAYFVATDTTLSENYFTVHFQTFAQPADSFEFNWLFHDGHTSSDAALFHNYDSVGIYLVRLSVEDNYGCASSYSERVTVVDEIFVPNAFTPNNDNINDLLIVRTRGNYIYNMHVYSRTGTLVYKTQAPLLYWDGRTMSGAEANTGIYYYVIESQNAPVPVNKSGFFYLFR